jgi:hypothetical protein
MDASDGSLTPQVVERSPLELAGASGNRLERVTLRDGRELILKRVSPEWDWITRATNDRGRIAAMWSGGLFDRFPSVIDHATVAVEVEDGSWSVFMRDVSDAVVPQGQNLDRAGVRRLLEALAQLHEAFQGETFPELCSLEDRYRLLSFETARREEPRGNRVAEMITRSWDAFAASVPTDITESIFMLVERPALLAEQLAACTQTLIHGDVRLTNLGFTDDRVVMLDWGERTGSAPAAVELASFLIFDALQLEVQREEVIAWFRELQGDRFEERALQLALIGGFVQLGANFGLRMTSDDPAKHEPARADLRWWIETVDKALETWSPR